MRKRLLSLLAAIALVISMTIPFATPVFAAAPVLTSITPHQLSGVPSFITTSGVGTTYYGLTFTGTFTNPPTAVTISGTGLTVSAGSFGSITTTSFTGDLVVAAGAAHGPRWVTVTTSDGVSNILYTGILVGEFPSPSSGGTGAEVGISIVPYYDAGGLFTVTSPSSTPIITAVVPGTTIWYRASIYHEDPTKFNFLGGQLSVRFPANPNTNAYIPIAGWGATTPAYPEFPEVKPGSPFTAFSPVPYIASAADLDASGFLIAETDYGSTGDHPTEINGVVEGTAPTTLNASITNSLLMAGSLRVTKAVVIPPGVPLTGLNKTFTVTVTGPGGYNNPLTFTVTDGVLVAPTYYDLDNLTPGTYHVAESPGSPWVASAPTSGNVDVTSGGDNSTTLTNTYVPGSLKVTKELSIPGAIPLPGINGTFSVHVSGTDGYTNDLSFTMTDGVITSPASGFYQIDNLTAGATYTLSETPGTPWNVSYSSSNTAVVVSGSIVERTVTNTYVPGSLKITKALSIPQGVILPGLDKTFSVHVAGTDGYSNDFSFVMTDGLITSPVGASYTIDNLTVGATYTISETPGSPWTVSYSTSNTAVVVTNDVVERTVTNTYVPGSLKITKALSIPSGVILSGLSKTFSVHVAGTDGYTNDFSFVMTDGVITSPASKYYQIDNLTVGATYTISETPGSPWTVSYSTSNTAVVVTNDVVERTVTNTYVPGSLKITKALSIPQGVILSGLNKTFSVHVAGTDGYTNDFSFVMTDGLITSPVGASYTIDNLTVGATYTISETPGSPWTVSYSTSNTAVVVTNDVVERTVTNTYVPGSLKITKALSIPSGVILSGLSKTFSVHVAGTDGYTNDFSFVMTDGVITSPASKYYQIDNLTVGATYTISETPGSPWTVSYSTSNTAVVVTNDVVERTVTNTYVPGSLKITKALSIPSGVILSGLSKTFSVHVAGTDGYTNDFSFVMTDGVITSPASKYYQIDNLTVGATYTISETPGSPWTVSYSTSNTAVVVTNDVVERTVTNTYVPGSLKITKALSIPQGVILSGLNKTFSVHVSGTDGYSNDFSFVMTDGLITSPVGASYTIDNLTVGATYTISETPGSPWTVSYSTSNTAVVVTNDVVERTVTNTYVPGSLKITKALSIPSGVILSGLSKTFSVHVAGTDGYTNDFSFVMTDGVITSPASKYYQIDNLTVGATYTISETPGSPWTVSYSTSNTAVVVTNDVVERTVTNTYVPGSLKITKALSIPQGVILSGLNKTFSVHVAGTDGYTNDFSFVMTDGLITSPVGASYTIDNLTVGATYTISETPGSPWTVSYSTSNTAVVVTNDVVERTVTNTYVPGSLKITKALSIPSGVILPGLDKTFSVHVAGTDGYTNDFSFVMTDGVITSPASKYYQIDNLTVGATYTISETPGSPWTVSYSTSNTAVVVTNDVVERTVTNTYVPGSLKITKALSIPSGVILSGLSKTFSVHVAGTDGYTNDFSFVMTDGVITSPASKYYQIDNLTVGATYTISETPGSPWTVSYSTSNTAVVVTDDVVERTVTNTYVPGSLKITKALSIPSGVILSGLNKTFSVHVAGTDGYTNDFSFVMTDGVITSPASKYYQIDNLTVGATYTISETPGSPWTVSYSTSNTAVVVTNDVVERTVTNTYVPGSLKITKALSIPSGVILSGLNKTFSVHVAGTDGYTNDFSFVMTDGVITSPASKYYQIDNLTVGATYTISETPGSPWTVSYSTSNTAVVVTNDVVERTVTNTYVPGSLKITKALSIPSGVILSGLSKTFSVHVAGTDGYTNDFSFVMTDGVITSPASKYYQIDNLTVGATYTISETPGSPWTVSYSTSNTAVVVTNDVVERTVTNTYVPGSLKITKALSIPSGVILSGLSKTFSVHVAGTDGYSNDLSFTMTDGVITSPASKYYQIDNLTVGATYTISETPGSPWTVSYSTSNTAVVVTNDVVERTVTNTYVPGSLKITKALSIPQGVILSGLNKTFSVHVAGTDGYSNDFSFVMTDGLITSPVGASYTIDNLTVGATYTISETPGSPWTVSYSTSNTAVVVTNDVVERTVTNTYVPGSLKITKALSIPSGVILSGLSKTFSVHVAGTDGYSNDLSFNMTDGVITSPASKYYQIDNLTEGATYTISETPGSPWTVSYSTSNTAVVVTGSIVERTVTNTYVPGSLKITKALSIPNGVILPGLDKTFSVHVAGTDGYSNDFSFVMDDGVITSPVGASYTIDNLTVGATYTISETPGSPWTVSYSTSNTAVVVTNDVVERTVTNTYVPGSLKITKALSIPSGVILSGLSKTFSVHVAGTDGYTNDFSFVMTDGVITSPASKYYQIDNLTVGATYTISETPGSPWTVSYSTSNTAVVVTNDVVERTVTNTYVPGSLKITKALSIPSSIVLTGLNKIFTVHVSGTDGYSNDFSFEMTDGLITLPAGGYYQIDNLTVGATYTISETPGSPWTVSYSTSNTAVVVTNTTVERTVTNTYIPGSLTVTKVVVIPNGVLLTGITASFDVIVTGPHGYTDTHTFTVTNGVLQAPASYTLTNLEPGLYHVAETPGSPWTVMISGVNGDVEVASNGGGSSSTVTNTYVPGFLTVTKNIVLPNDALLTGINDTFDVIVNGPNGYTNTHTFTVTNGVLQAPTSYTLANLVPGLYTVTETPGVLWSVVITNSGNVQVSPGVIATSTVTNTRARPHTSAALTVSDAILQPTGGDVTITVSDINDGDVPLTVNHMHLKISPTPGNLVDPIDLAAGYYLDNIAPEVGTFAGQTIGGVPQINDNIMQVGETWTWTITVHVTKDTSFQVTGHGTDPAGNSAGYPEIPTEIANGNVKVPPPVPASTNFGIGLLIACFAGAMLYLVRRKGKGLSSVR